MRSQSVSVPSTQPQQPLQAQTSGGKGLWSRFTSQLKISSGDQDGDTEDETVLATALVKFYAENKGGVPNWLGTCKAAKAYAGAQQGGVPPPSAQSGGVIRPGGSSLQEIYKRTNSSATAMNQPQTYNPNGPRGSVSSTASAPAHITQPRSSQDYNQGGGSWRSAPASGAGGPAVPDKADRFRNKLRSAGRPGLEPSGSSVNSNPPPAAGNSGNTASWRSKATW